MTPSGIDALPDPVWQWLTEVDVEEVVLLDDGRAWVRMRRCTEPRELDWRGADARAVLRAVERAVATGNASTPHDVDVSASSSGQRVVVRLAPRSEETVDLAGLQRDGLVLPEIRAAVEETIRAYRGLMVASPTAWGRSAVFDAVVDAWKRQAWVHELPPGASVGDVRAACGLGPDAFVAERPAPDAWPELARFGIPLLVRVTAPSSARALRRIAATVAAHHPELTLAVARELVVSTIDLVLEEETDGRARGAWRVLPSEVPAVEFAAGTKARLSSSTPPEPAEPPARADPDLQSDLHRADRPGRSRSEPAPRNGLRNGGSEIDADFPPFGERVTPDDETPDIFRSRPARRAHPSATSAPDWEPPVLDVPEPAPED